jgi:plastocyanin
MRIGLCSAWLVAAAALAACGDGGPASKSATTVRAPAGASPTDRTLPPPQPATPDITIVAKNLLFDKTELTAAAGAISVALINQDAGDVHNIHFFRGADTDGTSVGMTYVTQGPSSETITLNLAAGSYVYRCDVHPALMKGILTVS